MWVTLILTFGGTITHNDDFVTWRRSSTRLCQSREEVASKEVARDNSVWYPCFLNSPAEHCLCSIGCFGRFNTLSTVHIISKLRRKESLMVCNISKTKPPNQYKDKTIECIFIK